MKTKKLFAFLLAFSIICGLSGCNPAKENETGSTPTPSAVPSQVAATIIPGTYTASLESIGGPMQVSVTLSDTSITSIDILECNDTDGIADEALRRIPQEILDQQTVNVDTVAGATITSANLRAAIQNAVKEGCGDNNPFNQEHFSHTALAQSNMTADVVVVGAGIAGLTAALASADKGLNTILLEKNGYVGATALVSEGAILDTFTEPIASGMVLVQDLLNRYGTEIYSIGQGSYGMDAAEGHSMMATLITNLKNAAEEKGVKIFCDTPCTGLINEGGTLSGVTAQPKGQDEFSITAPAVILCTGGFASNRDLVAQYLPEFTGMRCSSLPGAMGDALTWIQAFDGKTIMLDSDFQGYAVNPTTGYRASSGAMYPLYVNAEGEKFSESAYYTDAVHAAWQAFGSNTFYAILTDKQVEDNNYRDTMNHMLTAKSAIEYHSIDEIASAYGLTNLKETMLAENYSEDDIYYVSPAIATIYSTYGGIAINENGNVLNNSNQPIPGLYAAGEVIGSPNYQQVGMYYGQLAPGMIMGIIAAQHIAANQDK